MTRNLVRKYGAGVVVMILTVVSVFISVIITIIINQLVTHEWFNYGVLIALVVSATLTPLLSLNTLKLLEQLDRIESQLKVLSITDDLTHVYNRRYFMELASHEFDQAKRYNQVFAVAMMDLDNFKDVNDGFGHQAGNHVLEELCRLCLAHIRASDTMARYGGDEFIFLLPNTDSNHAREGAERIRQMLLDRTLVFEGHEFRIRVSIGVAIFNAEDQNLDDLLKRADKALYQVKNSGGNACLLAD